MTFRRAWIWLPLLWGAAEATVFFIVADVAIGWIALRHGWRAGVIAAIAATFGATLGGAGLYAWSARNPGVVERVIEAGPAVSRGAVAEAASDMARDPRSVMLRAAFTGKPYRVYAAAAPRAGLSLGDLTLLTPPVRAPRFLLIALVFAAVGPLLRTRLSRRVVAALFLGGWLLFYAGYWTLTPW